MGQAHAGGEQGLGEIHGWTDGRERELSDMLYAMRDVYAEIR